MNYEQLKSMFITLSGRADLADAPFGVGADFFLNAGQRFLDESVHFQMTPTKHIYGVKQGQKTVTLRDAKALESVYFALTQYAFQDTVSPRVDRPAIYHVDDRGKAFMLSLEQVSHVHPTNNQVVYNDCKSQKAHYCPPEHDKNLLRRMTLEEANRYQTGAGVKGRPSAYYTTYNVQDRIGPDCGHLPASFLDIATRHFRHVTLNLRPIPSIDGFLEVYGQFYTEPFTGDPMQETRWSILHESLLIQAGLYQLEVFYRNSEGARDWLQAIMLELDNIMKMDVAETLSIPCVMEG